MSPSFLTRLRQLDCCLVSDAIDKLAATATVVTDVPQQSGAGRIAGIAVTMQLGTGDPAPGPLRHLGTRAIEAGGADTIIVIEQRTGIDAACWGGLLSLAAKLRHIAGVVADGPVRDIDEARGYDFPIFTRTLTARTARNRIVEKATQAPVTLWGATVNPGDYVLADSSAIIFIRPSDIEAILQTAEHIAEREAAMTRALRAGVPASQVMNGAYEHLLKDRWQPG